MTPALKLILFKGVGFLPGFMASQADGFWYDFSAASRLFQGTDEATPVTAFGDVIGRANDRRTGANSPRNATQATVSLKPKFQTTGAVFDGSDDNLMTTYVPVASSNFIVARLSFPASVPLAQVAAGNFAAASAASILLGVGTNGQLRFRAGNTSLQAGADLRGTTAVVGVSNDGATVRAFAINQQIYSAAQVGAVETVLPLRLGALNNDGAASSFFGGSIKAIVVGRQFLDLTTFNRIANAL